MVWTQKGSIATNGRWMESRSDVAAASRRPTVTVIGDDVTLLRHFPGGPETQARLRAIAEGQPRLLRRLQAEAQRWVERRSRIRRPAARPTERPMAPRRTSASGRPKSRRRAGNSSSRGSPRSEDDEPAPPRAASRHIISCPLELDLLFLRAPDGAAKRVTCDYCGERKRGVRHAVLAWFLSHPCSVNEEVAGRNREVIRTRASRSRRCPGSSDIPTSRPRHGSTPASSKVTRREPCRSSREPSLDPVATRLPPRILATSKWRANPHKS